MPDQLPHPHYPEDAIINVETHHEESDVNVRALLWFVVAFVVFACVMNIGILLMFKFFVQLERGNTNAPLTAVARSPGANVPAAPRLQPFPTKGAGGIPPYRNTPVTDMEDMRAHEEQVLNSYGWADRPHGVVHIPIAEAGRLALHSNLFPVNTGSMGTATVQTGGAQAVAPVPPADTGTRQ